MAQAQNLVLWDRAFRTSSPVSEIGSNATINGSPTSTATGKWQNGLLCNLQTEYLKYTSAVGTSESTISFTLTPEYDSTNAVYTTSDRVCCCGDSGQSIWVFYKKSGGGWSIGHAGVAFSPYVERLFYSGIPMHIQVVYKLSGIGWLSSKTVALYIDGVLVVSANIDWTSKLGSMNTTYVFGSYYPAAGRFFSGTYSDIKTYSTAIEDLSNNRNNQKFGGAKRRIS
jgi:hypothetical protein